MKSAEGAADFYHTCFTILNRHPIDSPHGSLNGYKTAAQWAPGDVWSTILAMKFRIRMKASILASVSCGIFNAAMPLAFSL
jgi:hypothetical protein